MSGFFQDSNQNSVEKAAVISLTLFLVSPVFILNRTLHGTVKLGNKERFDKEQIGIKKPFPVTNLPFTS